MNKHSALEHYSTISRTGGVAAANPHGLIQMLFEGALDRLAKAKGALKRKEYEEKGELINKVISILGSLQASLNFDVESDLSKKLGSLYEYMEHTLFQANFEKDAAKIDEVITLLKELKEGWEGIKDEANALLTAQEVSS